jgi:hypothetical protein
MGHPRKEHSAGRARLGSPGRDVGRDAPVSQPEQSHQPRDETWSLGPTLAGQRETTRDAVAVRHARVSTARPATRKQTRRKEEPATPSESESDDEDFSESGSEFSESDGESDGESESDAGDAAPRPVGVRGLWHTASRTVMAARSVLTLTSRKRTGASASRKNDPASEVSSFDDDDDDDASQSSSQSEPSVSASDPGPEAGDTKENRVMSRKHSNSALKDTHLKSYDDYTSSSDSEWDVEAAAPVVAAKRKEKVSANKPVAAKSRVSSKLHAQQAAHVAKASRAAERKETESRWKQKGVSFATKTGEFALPEKAPLLGYEPAGWQYSQDGTLRNATLKKTLKTGYSSVTRFLVLSALALIGVVMVSAGARSVFLANDAPSAVASSQSPRPISSVSGVHARHSADGQFATSASTTHPVAPFPVNAGIRVDAETDTLVSESESQRMVDAALASARRERAVLSEKLKQGGLSVVDDAGDYTATVGEADGGAGTSSGDSVFDDALFDDLQAEVSDPEPVSELTQPAEEVVTPEPAHVEVRLEPTPEPVTLEVPTVETTQTHEPHITPEMSYEEQQAEFSRFAQAEAAYNNAVAAEAAESVRRNAEDGAAAAMGEAEAAQTEAALDAAASQALEEVAHVDEEPVEEQSVEEPPVDEVTEVTGDLGEQDSEPVLSVGERLMIDVPDDSSQDALFVVETRPMTKTEELKRAAFVAGLGTE